MKKQNVYPYVEEFSCDDLTSIKAFHQLRENSNQSFFLESVEGEERFGRYSYLGINPILSLEVRNGQVVAKGQLNEEIIDGQPLEILEHYLDSFLFQNDEDLPPFVGGFVGHIGYDCVQYLEDISLPKKQKIEGAEAVLMLFQDIICFDRFYDRVLIIGNTFCDDKPNEKQLRETRKRVEGLKRSLLAESPRLKPFSCQKRELKGAFQASLGQENFLGKVDDVKKLIKEGEVFQTVISDRFHKKTNACPFEVYRRLRNQCPAPYTYFLDMPGQTLLGASPELFVRVQDGEIFTSPIAGTRPRGKTNEEDIELENELLNDEKEKAEHLMLVDLGRNDMGRNSIPGSVQVTEYMRLKKFSQVMHLTSLVKGKLERQLTPFKAFLNFFPAGTLSGAPKIRAMQAISELEPERRGSYGGAIIYQSFSGSLDSCITIRSLLFERDQVSVQAGAGIVADSNPEAEYQEVLNKVKAVQLALESVEGGAL